ncbi:MAG: hypothetical protein QM607_09890 [Microbacterium sp.]
MRFQTASYEVAGLTKDGTVSDQFETASASQGVFAVTRTTGCLAGTHVASEG